MQEDLRHCRRNMAGYEQELDRGVIDHGSAGVAASLAMRAAAVAIAVLAAAAALAWLLAPGRASDFGLTRHLFVHQDIGFVAGFIFLLLLWRHWLSRRREPEVLALHPGHIVLLAFALLLICRVGSHLAFSGFDLSRDEQLADFDAAVYAHGAAFARFPEAWRPWFAALNDTFLVTIGDREGWISSYLPMNAVARALVGRIVEPAWTSPLFVAIGAVALWRIARRLWPASAGAQIAVLLLYAGSSQLLVAGMTAYAMSGHLALNLVWLALFLRGGRLGHGGALAVALVATGLHQPLFHPLFALPFVDLLYRRKQWRLFALYAGGYAAIGLFWLAWPLWVASHGVAPAQLNPEGVGYFERIRHLLPGRSLADIGLMSANLVRFLTWQHLLATPLAILGVIVCWRSDPFARALAMGIILTLVAMSLLMPYQGHGWGYRYLHGLIGNFVLLGGYGWHYCETRGLRLPIRMATVLSLCVLFPVHALLAHRQAAPYIDASRVIGRSAADIVVVDDEAASYAADLVINRPDLSNRPLRMRASRIDPATVRQLCRRGTLAFVDAAQLQALNIYFGLPLGQPTRWQQTIENAAGQAGCVVTPL
ncbi:hypothetical protein MZO42_01240 [Sphingomonas psychrotolerans]|uniref:DUF2029 domain-containing protein n=1 Tax=Sphingomonas psychrotolerans TaxID=1327635 RepID=A0ABU3N255_9SPHN|nr:hypothetical protein [Sphingomonas psychrotolerans]MDT8757310.1 hypothetical protein [Sphingomonas psychrotolerans]